MTSNRELWHYFSITKLSALLKSTLMIFCLNVFHSFKSKGKLESHKKVYEDEKFCKYVMLSKDTKIIKLFNTMKVGRKQLLFL